jgi:hypothetical protein
MEKCKTCKFWDPPKFHYDNHGMCIRVSWGDSDAARVRADPRTCDCHVEDCQLLTLPTFGCTEWAN